MINIIIIIIIVVFRSGVLTYRVAAAAAVVNRAWEIMPRPLTAEDVVE